MPPCAPSRIPCTPVQSASFPPACPTGRKPPRPKPCWPTPTLAYISRYALGRDYHKTIRNRLQKLADRIANARESPGVPFSYRVFSDSAPVMEVEFARQAGTAWRGKHTLSLTRGGSWHFLGEIYTSLPLPPDAPIEEHCGTCTACIDACPTQAIVAPYEVDARRCISYLTIELAGADSRRIPPTDRQPHLRLRRLPALLPVEPFCHNRRPRFRAAQHDWTPAPWPNCSPGAKPNSTAACRAARFAASATSAGCATLPSHLATRQAHRK